MVVFRVLSELGKVVSLDEDRWRHVLEHPEMQNQLERIKETVANLMKSEKAYMTLLFSYFTSFTRKLR